MASKMEKNNWQIAEIIDFFSLHYELKFVHSFVDCRLLVTDKIKSTHKKKPIWLNCDFVVAKCTHKICKNWLQITTTSTDENSFQLSTFFFFFRWSSSGKFDDIRSRSRIGRYTKSTLIVRLMCFFFFVSFSRDVDLRMRPTKTIFYFTSIHTSCRPFVSL